MPSGQQIVAVAQSLKYPKGKAGMSGLVRKTKGEITLRVIRAFTLPCIIAAASLWAASQPLHAATSTFRCMNTSSGTTWDVKVDYDRVMVDSFPATITASEISWKDTKEGGNYSLDRSTGALTYVNSSSMGGYLLFHTCHAS
jgi:hypothetical protein